MAVNASTCALCRAGDHPPHGYELDSIVPDSDNMTYDMHEILLRIFDDSASTGARWASSPTSRCIYRVRSTMRCPTRWLDSSGCDSYNLPMVFVVDIPRLMPGAEREKRGIIRRGGRFHNAVVEAEIPDAVTSTW